VIWHWIARTKAANVMDNFHIIVYDLG
jgi:hypothetical protein